MCCEVAMDSTLDGMGIVTAPAGYDVHDVPRPEFECVPRIALFTGC
jgi:hypothetical protein